MIGKKLLLSCFVLWVVSLGTVQADEILIMDEDFNKYLSAAKPGDVFKIFPGVYKIKGTAKLEASGMAGEPIIIRPTLPGSVTIVVTTTIGFKISGSNWIVEDLKFVGMCETDDQCQHAMQIVGDADFTTIRRNTFNEFNSTIKANGIDVQGGKQFPDNVLIEGNQIFNNRPRETGYPVTLIDVVGGKNWVVRDNFIADFHKLRGNNISYAAFLKGNSENGLFERNLVICEWRHKGGVRLGLSLGGGGTEEKYCYGGNCKIEHYKGVIRGNVIMNCPADVGIYLNKAANTQIVNNTILNSTGVDVRFSTSFAMFANNIIEGRIKDRDDGTHREENNLVQESMKDVFPNSAYYDLTPANQEILMKAARDYNGVDFCTGERQDTWIGAFSQPAKCTLQDKLSEIHTQ
ncbi:NosD domain-containing protein [Kordiimonas pumila]|uniref:NosD domain-containing protein n=1 Tax=Kordiimonas pumila TaxID=2161677 RepID=A0ABV7D9S4_9PROT|nr:NosD domain-containing protein [Kordiimonas pumila]